MCCKTHGSRGENIFAGVGTSLISIGGALAASFWQRPLLSLLIALGGYMLAPPALRYVWRILKETRRDRSVFFSLGVWCLMILILSPGILVWFWAIVKNELGLFKTEILEDGLKREKSAAVVCAQEIINNTRSVVVNPKPS